MYKPFNKDFTVYHELYDRLKNPQSTSEVKFKLAFKPVKNPQASSLEMSPEQSGEFKKDANIIDETSQTIAKLSIADNPTKEFTSMKKITKMLMDDDEENVEMDVELDRETVQESPEVNRPSSPTGSEYSICSYGRESSNSSRSQLQL